MRSHASSSGVGSLGAMIVALVLIFGSSIADADDGRYVVPFPDDLPDFIYNGTPPIPDSNGAYFLVGAIGQPDRYSPALAIVKLRDSKPVPEFGVGGIVRHSVWGAAEYGVNAAVQNDGRIIVVGVAIDPSLVGPCYLAFCTQHTVILRLNPDGSLDTSFNGTGRVVVHFGPIEPGEEENDAAPAGAVIMDNGDLVIYATRESKPLGQDAPIGYVRADGRMADDFGAAPGRIAWVFYNPRHDRYFVTADNGELEFLANRSELDWRASLSGFPVYPPGTDVESSVPVCRFYDLLTRSHLISANASECALIERQRGSRWIFESGEVFRIDLPDPQTGQCGDQRAPVYRLWNPGDGSHMLTPDKLLRADLIAENWVSEGWGPDGVAMCGAP